MYKFRVGQVIHHRLYDYRGVIVEVDKECEAPDEWYLTNRTQPHRDRPWYHVLADGGHETYVAEENIESDSTGIEIDHPLVKRIFPTFHNGRYFVQGRN